MFLKNLSIAKKLGVLIFTAIFFLALVGSTGYYYLAKTDGIVENMYRQQLLSVQWLDEGRAHQRAIEADILELMITNNGQEKNNLLTDVDRRVAAFNEILANYAKNDLDETEQRLLNEIKQDVRQYREHRQASVDLALAGRNTEAYALYIREARPLGEALNRSLIELATYNEKAAEQAALQSRNDIGKANKTLAGLSLAALILVSGLGWRIEKLIAGPLKMVTAAVQEVASGNLTVNQLQIDSQDEPGQVAAAINSMVAGLRSLIAGVNHLADQLAASAEELTASSQQSAEAANSVAQSVTEVAGGAEQSKDSVSRANAALAALDRSAKAAQDDVGAVAHLAQSADAQTVKGGETVSRAVAQMETIGESAGRVDKTVNKLDEGSKQISAIVGMISSIAGQTNLLALNAAIEAARAGEQGRGFAVVAEEVRKLAEQSQTAANQIIGLIDVNGADIAEAVEAVQEANRTIAAGVADVRTAGEQFDSIAAIAREVRERAEKVSGSATALVDSSREIMSASEKIGQVVDNTAAQAQSVSAATEEQLASMQEIASSSESLAHLAQEMKGSVNKFRV